VTVANQQSGFFVPPGHQEGAQSALSGEAKLRTQVRSQAQLGNERKRNFFHLTKQFLWQRRTTFREKKP
jgi:hypothetical protein